MADSSRSTNERVNLEYQVQHKLLAEYVYLHPLKDCRGVLTRVLASSCWKLGDRLTMPTPLR
jgi:hypothetical protein